MIKTACVLFGAVLAQAHANGDLFRVRSLERRAATIDASDYVLTHSDDGKSKTLDAFLLDIFETPGELDEDVTWPIVRMALNKFLLNELSDIYGSTGNNVMSVGSEILDSSTIPSGGSTGNLTGTELEMEVTLTFDYEPSPSFKELEENLLTIMSDLDLFVVNLISYGNAELKDVTEAYRREIVIVSPTPAPNDAPDPVIDPIDKNPNSTRNKSSVAGAVPAALVGASLIALVVFLVFQRRGRRSVESPKGEVMMYGDVENDLYSMDKSLASSRSPTGMVSPRADSSQYSTSAEGSLQEDSVFAGIDHSPSHGAPVRTTKSLMSGFTNASSSTIQVSNIQKQDRAMLANFSKQGDALYFDEHEEDYGPEDDDDDLLVRGARMAPPELTHSDISDEPALAVRNHTQSPGATAETDSTLEGASIEHSTLNATENSTVPSPSAEPASSNHVLADLATLALCPRDPTPTAKLAKVEPTIRDPTPRGGGEGDAVVSYNPFNCNPIRPSDAVVTEASNFKLDKATSQTPTAQTPRESIGSTETPLRSNAVARPPSVNSTMKTPLQRNAASTSYNPEEKLQRSAQSSGSGRIQLEWEESIEVTPTVGSMSGRATSVIGGAFGTEEQEEPNDKRLSSSLNLVKSKARSPRSPQMQSRSAPTTPTRSDAGARWLRTARAMPKSPEDDYVDNLSRPSTPGGELANSYQVYDDVDDSGYGCLPFRNVVDKAPDGADPPAYSSGRRHAGNISGADGSAMYQTNAMHPLDWSYKSADIQSVGDSTISEHDEAAMPRQFLFAGKERSSLESAGKTEPKTPMSEASGKTNGTTGTTGSSHASASRQLINDLVWLEKKIADVRQGPTPNGAPVIESADSLSYVSTDNEGFVSASSQEESGEDPTVSTGKNESVMSSIVCRDCYAPPGKLHIVIHSTKDGPAVHTVKEGSSLEGHIFPGDLIISVDNVDTRSYTAEHVMKMMASKSDQERKITVLHFDEED